MKRLIQAFLTLGALMAVTFSAIPAAAHVPGLSLSGRGTAAIDGVMAAGEWDAAAGFGFTANVPGGSTTPATLLVMNDATNLYLGVRMNRPALDASSSVQFAFDNNHNGVANDREDLLMLISTLGTATTILDGVGRPGGIVVDTAVAGATNGAAAAANIGGISFYEISHPLNGGDVNDFTLRPGRTVGFDLAMRLCDAVLCTDTSLPSNSVGPVGFGDIVIAPPFGTILSAPTSGPFLGNPFSTVSSSRNDDDKDRCKDDGWRQDSFRNQGQCVSSVVNQSNHGRDDRGRDNRGRGERGHDGHDDD